MITIGVMIVGMTFGVYGGYLGGKYTPIKVLVIGGVSYLLSVVILFPIFATSNKGITAIIMIAIAIIHGFFSGSSSV